MGRKVRCAGFTNGGFFLLWGLQVGFAAPELCVGAFLGILLEDYVSEDDLLCKCISIYLSIYQPHSPLHLKPPTLPPPPILRSNFPHSQYPRYRTLKAPEHITHWREACFHSLLSQFQNILGTVCPSIAAIGDDRWGGVFFFGIRRWQRFSKSVTCFGGW